MYKFLKTVIDSNKFLVAEVTLHVYPQLLSLKAEGYIELRKYESDALEDQHKEIKKALKELITESKENVVVEVRSTPCMKPMKETMYEFNVSQKFESKEEKFSEVDDMKKKNLIDTHSFPVNLKALITKHEHDPNHEHYGNFN